MKNHPFIFTLSTLLFMINSFTLLGMDKRQYLQRSISVPNVKKYYSLHAAVKRGDLASVKSLLNPSSVNDIDMNGNSPLHIAIEIGSERKDFDSDRCMPASANDIEIIKHLIYAGGNVYQKNKKKKTPCDLALLSRDGFLLFNMYSFLERYSLIQEQIMLSQKKSPNKMEGGTPLHRAMRFNDIDLTQKLVDLNAVVSAIDEYGNTPLHLAANSYALPLTNLLVALGAHMDHPNYSGQTPRTLLAYAH